MTHDETRAELAKMDGWTFEPPEPCVPGGWWRLDNKSLVNGRAWRKDHPHPPTLDGANAAVPEGWTWNRWGCLYRGYHDGAVVKVSDHGRGHEMADLYSLALACRRAMEAAQHAAIIRDVFASEKRHADAVNEAMKESTDGK